MQKVFNVAVDIGRKLPAPAFEVNTNDLKSVKLLITITNGQTLLDLTDTTVRIAIRKPDNNIVFQDCTIKDAKAGQVEIVLENQAYIMAGTHTAEIMCYKGSEVVAVSGTFSYKSTKGIMNDEAVESRSEFTAINQKIEEARKLLEDAAESGVGVDEQARQEIQQVTAQLAETKNNLISTQKSLLPSIRNNVYVFDLDVNEAYTKKSLNYLNIPTYVEKNDEVVHPSILFFPDKWNGWSYWMAMTPYTDGDWKWENPSIVVSNDGLNWVVPEGVVNPIVPAPSTGYLADTVLFLDADGKTMRMAWKDNSTSPTIKLKMKSTLDGVNWSESIDVLVTPSEEVSPAIIWTGSEYFLWTVNQNNGSPQLRLRKSTNLTNWSNFEACQISNAPSGIFIWHMDIVKHQSQYHMLVQYGTSGGGSGRLYFAKSNDGLQWEIGNSPVLNYEPSSLQWDRILYKGALVPKIRNNEFYYGIYYGSNSPFYIGYAEMTFDKTKRISALTEKVKTELLYGVNKIDNDIILVDHFNRADSTTGLGTATSGQVWTNTMSTLGISNGKAYSPNGVNARTIINAGLSDFFVDIKFTDIGNGGWLMFRYIDPTNLWRVGFENDKVALEKIIGGVRTVIKSWAGMKAGNRIGVECKENKISVYINRELIESFTSTDAMAGTNIGLNIDNNITMLDDLVVKKVLR